MLVCSLSVNLADRETELTEKLMATDHLFPINRLQLMEFHLKNNHATLS
uniref:Uncharacterized protein n=1 Tax=Setaria italica TaxID=4555 RepID=K4AP38_SETIT